MSNLWFLVISNLIWFIEKIRFYPKLAIAYKELNLSSTIKKRRLVVFDVGANKGQSINFFIGIYPAAKIYAFEPSKKTFAKLSSTFKGSLQQDVELFQLGLGEFPGEINFYESKLDETSTFVLPSKDSLHMKKKNKLLFQKSKNAFKTTTAQIITVDDFVQDNMINHIDVLKIDVEGFEYDVLRGARISLEEKKINIIQLERHNNDMREDKSPEIDDFLKVRGYFKVKEIKHPFGDFFEMLYKRS
jgi:FkbM family methyltransferase